MDDTPPIPPHLLPPEHARHLPRSVSSESGRFREMMATSTSTSSPAPASYGASMHHRSNSMSSVSSAPASLPSKAVDGMEDNDQPPEEDHSLEPSFGELLDNDDASEAMMAPQRPASRSVTQPTISGQERTIRLTIRIMKEGDKLGFGIRNDPDHKLCVSTLQSNSSAANSSMRIGDTILSVNGVDLTNLGFLEVIQQLKATKPGELVFEIERTIVEPHATASSPAMMQHINADSPPVTTPTVASGHPVLPRQPTPALAPPVEQRPSHLTSMTQQATIMGAIPSARRTTPPAPQPAMPSEMMPEQPRKRARTGGMLSHSQLEVELTRHEKQHRAVVNALTLELKKEKTEKQSLEEKNGALRKRLQKMLIECDDVRVKANRAVTSIKDQSRRDIEELKVALQTARAQLRLQDRGPDVTRTDSIIGDLNAAKLQLDRFKKAELERKAVLAARYSFESRVAERDAHRIRDHLISLTCSQLRDVARRYYGGTNVNMGPRKSGADTDSVLNVHFEGVRRLTLMKLFGLPVTFEWYSSEEYYSATLVRQTLTRQEDVLDVFGNALCHEERVGIFIVASAPMEIVYDPTIERVTLTCSWSEQNQIRELARNFRF
ncbi:hypothetical protein Poli38472_009279 [Pythium oligandrum]|uniref:PDZ domain-containing protein n=1 Tax=Pythium oligandrum TaxID=41045 RepID=A0A8K1CMK4_PYTOL|nr:hypothetical protein Poli38472_009279 [Pythium oligandrum]|eukprot:TMW65112.1 hypothetical protein Poli38472_009279 [Pythium oligandrum]